MASQMLRCEAWRSELGQPAFPSFLPSRIRSKAFLQYAFGRVLSSLAEVESLFLGNPHLALRAGSHYGQRSRGRRFLSTNQIARNQEFGLWTLHTMAKVQRPSHLKVITF
jgi:hypothetical protein